MTKSPKNIYNIPTHLCFVDALASYIMDSHLAHGGDTWDISDTLVLLPTRRAIQAVQDAFVRLSDGKPTILPRLATLGDVDEDELLFLSTELGEEYLTAQPAINPLSRRLIMARFVHKLHLSDPENQGIEPPTLSQILPLSDSLCQLLDQIQIEQVDIDKIDTLVPDAFASEHWVKNLDYLKRIKKHYPKYLQYAGYQDPMIRRNQLLEKQADLWQKNLSQPPSATGGAQTGGGQTGRIIIAGSTGSMPATAHLMDVVSTLPHELGAVILPGLDTSLNGADVDAIINDPAHPQYGLIKLLNRLDVNIHEVKCIGGEHPKTDRYKFLSQLMRPASTTHLWNKQVEDLSENALDNITLTQCDDSIAEARTIALLMREIAHDNENSQTKKTCTLITPDRHLSRQVLAILKRWGIDADDSAGIPLDNTKQGIFLRLILWVVRDDFAPVALLSLLKHPMMTGGKRPHEMRQLARALEYAILRGVRPMGGLIGLKTALQSLEASTNSFDMDKKRYISDAYQVLDILQPLDDFANILGGGQQSLSYVIQQHITVAEKLCSRFDESGSDVSFADTGDAGILWAGDAGDGLVKLLSNAMDVGQTTLINPMADYESMMQTFMAGTVTRPHGVRHPRLKILGAIEARMIKSDVVILGGLNEGTWPPIIESDHWLSRPMRQTLGLPPLERHISLSAHDFVQAFAAQTVHMTRAKKVGSQPTIPSRWIDRMNAVIDVSKNLSPLQPVDHALWQKQLDDVAKGVKKRGKIKPPAPVLRDGIGIQRLSSSDLEKLFMDPYGVYAKKILQLRKLNAPEQDVSVADVGNVIHHVLDDYLAQFPDKYPHDATTELNKLLDKHLKPYGKDAVFMAYWNPRYKRMTNWFLEQEQSDRPHIVHSYSELDGHCMMPLSTGNTIKLSARADRVDTMKDGTYRVVDYKTGGTATANQIRTAAKPQLLLASKILMQGTAHCNGIALPNAPVCDAQYWQIKGQGKDNIQSLPTITMARGDTIKDIKSLPERLEVLSDIFYKETHDVLSHFDGGGAYTVCPTGERPRYNDYEHLSRIREWSVMNDSDGGDNHD